MDDASRLSSFFAHTARIYDALDVPIAKTLSDELKRAAVRPPAWFECDRQIPAAVGLMPQVLETPDWASNELQSDLRAISGHLPWKARMASAIGNDFHLKYSAVELIGSEGVVHSDNCRLGLFLMVPDEFYASHHHAAEELYFVLSGTAEWQVDEDPFRTLAPRDITHHASWQPHATRTLSKPLLAIWGWIGDLDFKKYKMVNDTGLSDTG
ncbi:MAG: dimethylsulfonioproprionate lyase family protein [Hyphomicrobiales bacterium]